MSFRPCTPRLMRLDGTLRQCTPFSPRPESTARIAQALLSEVLTGHPPGFRSDPGHVDAGLLHFKGLQAERHLLQQDWVDAEFAGDLLAVPEVDARVRRTAGGVVAH